ncbi:MAG: DUF2184 domain-containing protein [Rhodopila sp.]|nr:DUF2184 domain-containing protein [Rhodopila sp.]
MSFGNLDDRKVQLALDEMLAMDAPTYNQQSLVTSPNAGIPAFLTTYLDPKLIEVLLSPLKSEEVYGVTKKGDWLTETAMFAMIENTGETAAYGDFNQSGRSGANVQYPQRQSFLFQTMTEWGERELERMGLGKVDWAARLNISSANTLNRFMNLCNFYGVSGLQNYGGLNDPSLSPALTPATKLATGTSWSNALPTEILADIQAGFAELQQGTYGTNGNLELTDALTLGIHPVSEVYLANTNSFGLTAMEMIRKVFPRLKVVTAVQYLSNAGVYSYQLIADEIEGQRTAECAFNEKMRAHRIVPDTSSYRQKKTAGTWGTIIYRPIGIASMAGI